MLFFDITRHKKTKNMTNQTLKSANEAARALPAYTSKLLQAARVVKDYNKYNEAVLGDCIQTSTSNQEEFAFEPITNIPKENTKKILQQQINNINELRKAYRNLGEQVKKITILGDNNQPSP